MERSRRSFSDLNEERLPAKRRRIGDFLAQLPLILNDLASKLGMTETRQPGDFAEICPDEIYPEGDGLRMIRDRQ